MRREAVTAFFGLLALATGTAALAQFYGLAAKVNGVGISNDTLERSYEEYLHQNNINVAAIRYPTRVKEIRRQVLDLLIEQELVWQSAQAKEIVATPEEVSQAVDQMRSQFRSEQSFRSRLAIEGYTEESYRKHMAQLVSARKYLDKVAAKVEVSDAEVHTFYVDNPDKFKMPEVMRARHILVKLSPEADEARKRAARETMAGILAELHDGADFAALAGRYSEDTSTGPGGDLGYFSRKEMVKAFADAAFTLKPGEVSGIVETTFGLHLIKAEDRRAARTVPEAEAREQVRAYLRKVKQQQAVANEIKSLRSSAQIEILLPL